MAVLEGREVSWEGIGGKVTGPEGSKWSWAVGGWWEGEWGSLVDDGGSSSGIGGWEQTRVCGGEPGGMGDELGGIWAGGWGRGEGWWSGWWSC